MRQAVWTIAAVAFFCLTGNPCVFSSEVIYTADGRAVSTVGQQEINSEPNVPGTEFSGPPSLFDDNPLKPISGIIQKTDQPEQLTSEEKESIEQTLREIEKTFDDFKSALKRISETASDGDEMSIMPIFGSKSSLSFENNRELTVEARERTLDDSPRRLPALIQIAEQNQQVADLTGAGETPFSLPAFEAFIASTVHFFRSKVSSVKDKLEEGESFQPFDLTAGTNTDPNAPMPGSLLPDQGSAQVLESVTLDSTIAAIHGFLNPPKNTHPLHQLLFYLSHVNSDDLRRYENTRRKIEEINRVAKAEELKVRYMGKVFNAGFIPLMDDGGGREARQLELLAQK